MTRSRRTFIGVMTLAGVVATAVAGCGGSDRASTATPAATISRAAEVSGAARGYRVRMTMREEIPDEGTATVNVRGAFATRGRSGTLAMAISESGTSAHIQEILHGSTVYMKFPAAMTARLNTTKPWLELDLSNVGKNSYLSSIASLVNNSSETSPASSFVYLKAQTTHLRDLGTATAAGVTTTHYRATVNLRKAGIGLPGSAHAAIQRLLTKLPGKILNETRLPIDVWIDSSNLIRKMQYTMKLVPTGSTQAVNTSLTIVMTGYGRQPVPAAPPANQTANLLALVRAEGGSGGA